MSRLGLRVAFCSVLAAASAGSARAADWPLRGSLEPGFARWDGWHAGLQAGYANMNTDPGNSTSQPIAFILRNTTLENEFSPRNGRRSQNGQPTARLYGAFVGYNMQWDNLVVGFDIGYKHPQNLDAGATDTIARPLSRRTTYNTTC